MTRPPLLTYGDADSAAVGVDLKQLVRSRMLVQSNSGGGKSQALRQLLEETHGRIPHLVIDPEGEFSTMRAKFDYVLAAKSGGDVEASPRTARILCRRLVETGASAILDLFELTIHDRREFVRLFLTELINLPRSLWRPYLVPIDEAHMFAPEKGTGEASSLESVIALSTLGRKREFCAVLATQRISKLHKDAAADLLNKLVGRTALDVDVKRAGSDLGFNVNEAREFRKLAPGEFYAYGPAISVEVVKVRTPAPDKLKTRSPEPGSAGAKAPAASDKVKALLAASLADLPKEAEAEATSIADLTTKVRMLNVELSQARKGTASTDEVNNAVRIAVEDAGRRWKALAAEDYQRGYGEGAFAERAKLTPALTDVYRELGGIGTALTDLGQKMYTVRSYADTALFHAQERTTHPPVVITPEDFLRRVARNKAGEPLPSNNSGADVERFVHGVDWQKKPVISERSGPPGDPSLPAGERAVLVAAAQYGVDGVDRAQISALVALKKSSRDAYVARLKQKGYLHQDTTRNSLVATEEGLQALGSFEVLPTGRKLQDYWLGCLPKGEADILKMVLANGAGLSPDAIGDAVELKKSSRDAYIARLAQRKLVYREGGKVKAAGVFFE